MQEEPNPIKDFLFDYLKKSEKRIQELTLQAKFTEIIDDVLENLTNVPVLGSIPFIDDLSDKSLYRVFKKNIDFKSLLN